MRSQFLTPLLLAAVRRLERQRAELTKQVADQAVAIAELRTLLDDLRTRMRSRACPASAKIRVGGP